jgi:hypothetical protein
MKRLWLGVAAAGLILASGLVDTASARVGFGGVGFRGGVGIGRVGFARPGLGVGIGRVGIARPGLGLGWRAGWGGWGVRRGWGWRWPVAAGIAAGVATAGWGYGSSCLAWNGYGWVNVCYAPYPYTYW